MWQKTGTTKGKRAAAAKDVAAEGRKKRAEELDRKRQDDVVFFLLNLGGNTMIAKYENVWGWEVSKGQGAPVVLPEGANMPSDLARACCGAVAPPIRLGVAGAAGRATQRSQGAEEGDDVCPSRSGSGSCCSLRFGAALPPSCAVWR